MDLVVQDLQWQGLGFSPDSPRPTVEFEAYTDPDDTNRVYTDCMVAAGYEDWDQQSYGSLGEPPIAERLDLYTCLSRFPVHPSFYGLYAPGQLEAMYDYYQDTLVPCMEASGVSVRAVPTREDFVGKPPVLGGTWNPYAFDYEMGEQEWTSLYMHCTDLSYRIGRPAN